MRKWIIGLFISIAVSAMSQDHGMDAAVSGSPARDFTSLEPFVRGLAMGNREVAIYRVRANGLPSLKYPKPFVIVWTKESIVTERKEGGASTTRKVSVGQIDTYPGGSTQSLRAVKGALHFTLIELEQSLRDPKELPKKPANCESVVELPQGGFACLIRIAPNQQVTIPELDVNSFSIAIDSGKVRYGIPRSHWQTHHREGQPSIFPGFEEHTLQNLEQRPLRFALIVPPPAEYN